MRVHLKGIHTTHKKLASGEIKKYYYAWKDGPRILAEPGTTEFLRLYNDALSGRKQPATGTMRSLVDYFKDFGRIQKQEFAQPARLPYLSEID